MEGIMSQSVAPCSSVFWRFSCGLALAESVKARQIVTKINVLHDKAIVNLILLFINKSLIV